MVSVVGKLGQLADRLHDGRADQRGRAHLGERVGVAVESQLAKGAHQGGALAAEQGEHGARYFGAPLEVQYLQFRPDVPMGGPLVRPVPGRVIADGTDDHVVLFGGAVRRVLGGEVREPQHGVPQLRLHHGALPARARPARHRRVCSRPGPPPP